MPEINATQLRVLADVALERDRQDDKWGPIHQRERESLINFLAVLGEEYGEACKAVLKHEGDNIRVELIQVAAVAVAIVEWLDGPTEASRA